MKQLAVVSTLPPDATGTGKSAMWGGLWRFMRDQVGDDAFTYVVVGRRPSACSEPRTRVEWIAQPTAVEQVSSLVSRAVLRGRPFQEAAIAHPRVERELRAVLGSCGADTVVADTQRISVMLRPPRQFRLVTYLDDLFSVRYERMLKAMRDAPNEQFDPLGNFATHLPALASRVASLAPVRSWLLRSEMHRTRRAELDAPRHTDLAVLISPDEAHELQVRTGRTNVVAVPPLIQCSEATVRTPDPEAPSYLFVGAMNVAHNDMAMRSFLAQGARALIAARPNARLDIIGRGVSAELEGAAAPFGSSVRFHGYVEDISPFMQHATCVVAPLVFGSGVKIKVVEALANSVPVVATSYGAEGIIRGTTSAEGLIVRDDIADFVQVCLDLTDAKLNAAASAAARHLYDAHYAPAVVHAAYGCLLG